jgi:DNA (cytosine-5)-methyltransferase 1
MHSLKHQKVAAVDLFCGVGGLTHGLGRSGIEVRAGIDIDPTCRYPFEANNSAIFLERDVSTLSASDLEPCFVDCDLTLLAGCAPCQPFSTYSQTDRRRSGKLSWQLVLEFGRLVQEIEPDLITMENVSQLASHSVFKDFVAQLRNYAVMWSVVEFASLGVPQSRKRLVLLASKLGSAGLEMPTSSYPMSTVRDTIEDLPPIDAGESDPSDRLHVASKLSKLNLQRIRSSKPGGSWRDWDPALRADCHGKQSGSTYPSVYGRMEWDKVAPTITTQCFGYGNGRFGHPEQDRAISLREAAMLQTFPRDYKFASDSDPVHFNRLGRLIGNAVPVRAGEAIGKVLMRHVALAKR